MHVPISCSDGEAKFWLEPEIVLAKNYGLSNAQVAEIGKIVEERADEITQAWHTHFRR